MPAEGITNFEPWVQWLYQVVLRKGDNCIDVGAHKGRHLFPMAAAVKPGGKVYALEPVPQVRAWLERKIARRGLESSIELIGHAASFEDGESEFVVALDALGYSGLRERNYDVPTRLQPIRVQVRRLDGLLGHLQHLRFIKIDVEGGEWGVIRGAAELITRLRPVVTFEFGLSSYERYGIDPREVWDFFASRDYLMHDIVGRPVADRQRFADSCHLQEVWDYAAIPREMQQESKWFFGLRARAAQFLPRAVLKF